VLSGKEVVVAHGMSASKAQFLQAVLGAFGINCELEESTGVGHHGECGNFSFVIRVAGKDEQHARQVLVQVPEP
jgi:hypothetical protein